MSQYDAVVIGAGPAGISAALYLARFGLSVALLEKMTVGGMLLQTAEIENYPGLPAMRGYALADALEEQLNHYPVHRLHANVTVCEPVEAGYSLLAGDHKITGKTILICSGLTYRTLGVPEEESFVGRGLSYCAICDGPLFKGMIVAVVGGGNAALEEALYLSGLVKELHLVHRRDAFRADKLVQEKILALPNVMVHRNATISALHGREALQSVTISPAAMGRFASFDLPVDGIFVFVGQIPASDFFPAGLRVDETGFIITDTEMCTNLPGVFAAGDIRSKHCRQVVTAAGDGATAARSAYLFLEENQ